MTATSGRVAMSGVFAIVRVTLDQQRADASRGLTTATLISGYRGSPVGAIDITYLRHRALMEANEVRFINGVNEELAATVIFGSQLANLEAGVRFDGVKGMWYGKGPGVDRSGDAFRHGNYSGVGIHGGVLVVAGDDSFCKSSTIPSGSEMALADAGMPILTPGTVQEVLDYGRYGYELSRFCGSWVGFKISTEVADAFATVEVDPDRLSFADIVHTVDGESWRPTHDHRLLAPISVHLEQEVLTHRLDAARLFVRENGLDRASGAADAWLGIVVPGKPHQDLLGALARLGFESDDDLESAGIRIYKPALTWPLEPHGLRSFAAGLDEILVIEEKRGFIEGQIKEILYGTESPPRVLGKYDDAGRPLIPISSGLDADRIIEPLRARLLTRIDPGRMTPPRTRIELPQATTPDAPQRTPYFCSGCPHNRSTLVPEGSVAGGGIGCHAMALMMDDRAHGITQMGGEGAQWAGMEPFLDDTHRFQNLGDGTFAHSGSLAIRQAIAAGSNVTFKILHNGVVAMTGGQDAAGDMDVPAMTRHLDSEGVRRIVVVTDDLDHYGPSARFAPETALRHRDDLDAIQRELREVPGVTALVYDQGCAADLRRQRRRGAVAMPTKRIMINQAVCDGCGHCGVISNCMSVHPVETPFGRKTRIHQESCNYDYTCVNGNCPAFITVEVDPADRSARRKGSGFTDGDVPDVIPPGEGNLLLVGIGGTGVVTVNQILGTAALLDGKVVHGLDQTGLSQKGGPVVSNLRIASGEIVGSNKLGEAEADTLLLFDVLAGLSPANLARASADRTVVVGSTSRLPTGRMVSHTGEAGMPAFDALRQRLDAVSRADESLYFDAESIASTVFASQPAANVVLLGAAYQLGRIPINGAAIEQAIELNGVATEINLQAFRLGRRLAVDRGLREELEGMGRTAGETAPALSGRAADLAARVDSTDRLAEVLAWRIPELIAYRDAAYASRYVDAVARVRAAESTVTDDDTLSMNVARHLFKLMAYKDEYEVARLSLAAGMEARAKARFGTSAKVTYMLKPPSLRIHRKIGFRSAVARPMFRTLAGMQRLRGTALDPFGRSEERKIERQLIEEYLGLVDRLLARLDSAKHLQAARIADLADQVRGFDEVKLDNVARYRAAVQAAITAYEKP